MALVGVGTAIKKLGRFSPQKKTECIGTILRVGNRSIHISANFISDKLAGIPVKLPGKEEVD